MKVITVPVFTEEYKIRVVFGNNKERAKYMANYLYDWDYEKAFEECELSRGNACNTLPEKHPLITIDETIGKEFILATLPHEASHCAKYIADTLGVKDPSGEWDGHIVSAVMRHCVKYALSLKN